MLTLALALGLLLAARPPGVSAAVPAPNPSPTTARVSLAPCLIVAASGCPLAPDSAPIPIQAPGSVVVIGANWGPGMTITVLLVPAAQPCTTTPAAMAQSHASVAGVFSIELPLPATAPTGALYAVCAATADGKQTFPAAGLTAPSPLRIRVVRAAVAAAPASTPPIDGFSLAALLLAALSAVVFVLSWLRGRRTQMGAE